MCIRKLLTRANDRIDCVGYVSISCVRETECDIIKRTGNAEIFG
jgi:hypothetical protein